MSIEFQTATIKEQETFKFEFSAPVKNATCCVQGFKVGFGSDDHHVEEIDIEANIGSITGKTVTATVVCKVTDKSNHVGNGFVKVTCIAETA